MFWLQRYEIILISQIFYDNFFYVIFDLIIFNFIGQKFFGMMSITFRNNNLQR